MSLGKIVSTTLMASSLIAAFLATGATAQSINPACTDWDIDTSYASVNTEDDSDVFVWIPEILVPSILVPLVLCGNDGDASNTCDLGDGKIVGSTSSTTAKPAACTARGSTGVYATMDYQYEESSGKKDRWTFFTTVNCPGTSNDRAAQKQFNDRFNHKDSGTGSFSVSWSSTDFPLGITECDHTLKSQLERKSWVCCTFSVTSSDEKSDQMEVTKVL